MKTAPKEQLLNAINELMSLHRLPRLAPDKLGCATREEGEIIGIDDFESLSDCDLSISYLVMIPRLGERVVQVRYGGSVCVIVPMFDVSQNGEPSSPKVALVKKWRPENADWSYELPRGRVAAAERSDLENAAASPAYRIIGETFGEDCLAALERGPILHIGKIDQRGEAASIDIVVMRAVVTQDFLRLPGDGRIVLVPLDQILKLLDDDQDKPTRLTETLTTAAMLKAARKLGW